MQYAKTTHLANLHEESIFEFLSTDDEPEIVNHMTDNEIFFSVLDPEEKNSETDSYTGDTMQKVNN